MWIKAPTILLEDRFLNDHAILVKGEKIDAILPQKEIPSTEKILELPHTILLPGLVNAHCHLELSQLSEPLPYPGSFVGWIEQRTLLKLQMSPERTKKAMAFGIRQLLNGGTTTIADHMSSTTSPATLMESPLEGIIYVEVLGVEEKRARQFFQEAIALEKIKDSRKKFQIKATPHAPYSLLPKIFLELIERQEEKGIPLSIHLSESAEEFLLFQEEAGPLYEFLRLKGDAPPTEGETPLHYLSRLHLLVPKTMMIHANYLTDEDVGILKECQMSVVHCPGSHAYFEHERFPLGLLEEAGINIALGTDSLASNESLSMFTQMRLAIDRYAELSPQKVFQMATIHGAKAFGREEEIGSLHVGKLANMIGIRHRFPKREPFENILLTEKADFVMIRGQQIL